MNRSYDVTAIFPNVFVLRKPRVAILADIIKILTIFIKIIFRDLKKSKEKLCLKIQSISVFLDDFQ